MLTRFDPFRDFFGLSESPFNRAFQTAALQSGATQEASFVPVVDISQTDAAYMIDAEIPGVKTEDIDIEVDRGKRGNIVLTLNATRKRDATTDDEGVLRTERVRGTFSRSFILPDHVDVDQIDAQLTEGVLHLVLPKKAVPEPRRISVRTVENADGAPPTTDKQAA